MREKLSKHRNAPKEMSFIEHLEELRQRIWVSLLAIIVCSIISFYFRNYILKFMLEPLFRAREVVGVENPRAITYTNPVNPFWIMLKVSVIGGFFLAIPVILWELWAFVSPGLYSKEKKFALPFVLSSTMLFVGGAIFCYWFVFPVVFRYLVIFSQSIVKETGIMVQDITTVDEYLNLALKLLLAFGLIFELPILTTFLSMAKIINYKKMIRFSRYFIVIAFVVGAILTPPDILSQILMALPLVFLYLISIGLSYLVGEK